MEDWKIAMMGLIEKEKLRILLAPYAPLFRHSIIPMR